MRTTVDPDLSEHQTGVLFVLVGENPLPNLVAARLLLRNGGRLYLVHSRGKAGTGPVAGRLAAHLRRGPGDYDLHFVAVNEHDAGELTQKIKTALDTTSGPVGLNYTGGTKFMAVHTYQAVEEFCEAPAPGAAPRREVVLSYLHADSLELAVEPHGKQDGLRRRVWVEPQLTFDDIFGLHGLVLSGVPQPDPQLPELAATVARINSTEAGVHAWRVCRKYLWREPRPWREAADVLRGGGVAAGDIEHLEATLCLEEDCLADLDAAAQATGLGPGGSLRIWLDGGWLEDWTLACIAALGCKERLRNLDGRIPGREPQDLARRFEIDVAVLRGYQLFALSCKAVASRKVAKLGLMEIFARARQMGGEEARAALVTTQLDADGLAQEFASDWGAEKRVRVFGCEQLPDLQDRLGRWFEER